MSDLAEAVLAIVAGAALHHDGDRDAAMDLASAADAVMERASADSPEPMRLTPVTSPRIPIEITGRYQGQPFRHLELTPFTHADDAVDLAVYAVFAACYPLRWPNLDLAAMEVSDITLYWCGVLPLLQVTETGLHIGCGTPQAPRSRPAWRSARAASASQRAVTPETAPTSGRKRAATKRPAGKARTKAAEAQADNAAAAQLDPRLARVFREAQQVVDKVWWL